MKTAPTHLAAVRTDPQSYAPAPAAELAGTPLSVEVMEVTPDLAKRWLEKNHPSNRPISWSLVEAFANDMRAGAWKLTHQAVCFDADGFLIDGQHRLSAVLQATATIRLLVIRNQAGSFHDPIDRGRPRSVATIMGVPGREISCLNVIRMLELGYQLHTPMTLSEAEQIGGRHSEQLQTIATIPNRSKLSGATLAACVWALPIGKERTIEFVHKTASGEMIGRGDPCFAFRAWKERNRRAQTWDVALAALNCLRHYLNEVELASVYTGEMGYRAFVSRRRALKIPNTPGPDIVPGVGWTPTRAAVRGDG